MISCTRVAAALLLSIGLCQAARDEGADKKGVLQAGSREAGLETIGVSTDHFAREAIAKGAKHIARAKPDGNSTEPEDEAHSEASDNGEDDGSEHGADDGSEHGSDDGSGSEHGPDEDGSRDKEDEGNSLAQETVEREQRHVLCEVDKGLDPSAALRRIEECVKELENIKEGTLQQGKSSWHHNNEYVKKLADMENRMTELARPEPFEIAFAVDQADMFDKLKNRLQAITLDLPKLQGKDAGELPGIPEKPQESQAPPPKEDATSGEPPEDSAGLEPDSHADDGAAHSAGLEPDSHADDGAAHASNEDEANSEAESKANSAGSEAAESNEDDEGTDSAEKPEAKSKVGDSS